jgi:arsenate reductase-like glutaredoxin family protein
MIENRPNEITLIYHSDKPDDRKARGYADSIKAFTLKTLDLRRECLTETQLAEIADKLTLPVRELVDITYAEKKDRAHIGQMDDGDLLNLLVHQPMLIQTPILIVGKKAFKYSSSYALISENGRTSGVENIAAANVEEKKTIRGA